MFNVSGENRIRGAKIEVLPLKEKREREQLLSGMR
jgi:hypothetical protein